MTKPVEEFDRERRVDFVSMCGAVSLDSVVPRTRVRVAGEVTAVRIVPRAGAPSLEVTINDGSAKATAIFFGRKALAGLSPGRRIVFDGLIQKQRGQMVLFNPAFDLMA